MKTRKKKLFLKKISVSNLQNAEMSRIYGGLPSGEVCCTENCYTGPDCTLHNTLDYTCPPFP